MADGKKEPRTAKPGTLLSQWWTLGELLRDERRARSHDAVLWVILDAHRAKTGRCPASVRYIKERLAGSIVSSDTIIKAIEDLEAWGYIKRLPRTRRNSPTEFIPNWVCVPAHRNTDSCVPVHQDTGVPAHRNTGVPADRNDTYLSRLKAGDKDIISPQSGAGLSAAPAGFALWTVSAASFGGEDHDELTVALKSTAGRTFRRRLSYPEYRSLQDAAIASNPAAADPSNDAREFVGAPVFMSREAKDGNYVFLAVADKADQDMGEAA